MATGCGNHTNQQQNSSDVYNDEDLAVLDDGSDVISSDDSEKEDANQLLDDGIARVRFSLPLDAAGGISITARLKGFHHFWDVYIYMLMK